MPRTPLPLTTPRGLAHQIDDLAPLTGPVLVVGVNERTDDQGRLLPGLIFPGESGSGADQAGPRLSAQQGECGPQPKGPEQVKHVYVRNAHEPRTRGAPEIMLQLGSQLAGSSVYQGSFPEFRQGRYSHPYRDTVLWGLRTLGQWVMYFWYERDGGGSLEVNLSGSFRGATVGVKYTVADGDDQMGHALVDVSQRYRYPWLSTGDIDWQRSSCRGN